MNEKRDKDVPWWQADSPRFVEVRYLVGEVLDVGEFQVKKVLRVDVAFSTGNVLEFISFLNLQPSRLLLREKGVPKQAELKLAVAEQE